jgi:hypothetical protein
MPHRARKKLAIFGFFGPVEDLSTTGYTRKGIHVFGMVLGWNRVVVSKEFNLSFSPTFKVGVNEKLNSYTMSQFTC